MAGATLTATLDDKQPVATLQRLGALMKNPAPLLRQIGMGLVAAAGERFETQTDPFGHPWKALNPAYAAMKRNTASGVYTRSSFIVQRFYLFE